MIRSARFVTILVLSLPSPLMAQHEALSDRMAEAFDAGYAGDTEAFDRAMTELEGILAANPDNADATAWYAEGLGYRAGMKFATGDAREGSRLWRESQRLMDEAVELDPEALIPRLVRGRASRETARHDPDPDSAARAWARAVEDLEAALAILGDGPLDGTRIQSRAQIYQWLVECHERLGHDRRAEAYREMIERTGKPREERPVPAYTENTSTTEMLEAALIILDSKRVRGWREDLRKAARRDKGAIDRLRADIGAKAKASPEDASLRAWSAYVTLLEAGRLFAEARPREGKERWEAGVRGLDRAVGLNEADRQARVLRGLTMLMSARYQLEERDRRTAARRAALDLARARDVAPEVSAPTPASIETGLRVAEARLLAGQVAEAERELDAVAELELNARQRRLAADLRKKLEQ